VTGEAQRQHSFPALVVSEPDALKAEVDALTPSLPPSRGYGGTGLARAWSPSPPARSGFALLLHKFRLAGSQRARFASNLVPQDLTDAPAEKLLDRVRGGREAVRQMSSRRNGEI